MSLSASIACTMLSRDACTLLSLQIITAKVGFYRKYAHRLQMNIALFIARRISVTARGSFTRIIVRIAIAAIALSLTVMILTTAIIAGFKNEISNKIFGFWGHINITDSNVNKTFELTPISRYEPAYDSIRDIDGLQYEGAFSIAGITIPGWSKVAMSEGGVQGAYPYIILPALLTSDNQFHGMLLKGLDATYDWSRLQPFMVKGSPLTFTDSSGNRQVMISRHISDKMKVDVGDKVVMSFIRDNNQIKRRFTICGIYNTGLEEYDRRFGIVDLAVIQDIIGWAPDQVQGIEVVVDDVKDLDLLSEFIYYEILPQQYYSESIKSRFPAIFEWLKLQDINETTIHVLMILVALINMITVLLILILERTQMIGILKAVGMSNWNIRKIFLYNAAYIIFYGLIIGNSVGLGIAFLQKKFGFITLDEANYYLDKAPVDIHLPTILWLNLGTFLVTVVFLVLPTLIVTRITPVRALRFD